MGPSLSIFDMIAVHSDGHPSFSLWETKIHLKELAKNHVWLYVMVRGTCFITLCQNFHCSIGLTFIAETTAYIKSAKKRFFSNNITSFLICSCVKTITGRKVLQVGENIGSKFKN